ncbi:MAG: DUF2079 domain-containing protein [archaeon]|nr:DUF2079 domain-containing protein [archaeon]
MKAKICILWKRLSLPIKIRSIIVDGKLYLAVSGYILIFSSITILKHHAFLSSGFDLGIFNQAFWTTLFDGKLFYETGDLSFNPSGSFFGTHFSPILLLLLPFYTIYPSVETLLVIQSAVLALGAVPLYWMARDKLGKHIAPLISLLYLCYPPLHHLNFNDFHLQAFLPTLFLFTIYYLERKCWLKYFAFLTLSMATIEFTPIIVIFVGLYGFKQYKMAKQELKYIIITIIVGVSWLFLALMAKEYFNPYTSPIPSTFNHVLSNPINAIHTLFKDLGSKVLYMMLFFAPVAFLPFLSPKPLMMTIPWMCVSFISTYGLYYSIYYQHTGFVIPFIFMALVMALRRLTSSLSPNQSKKVLKSIMIAPFLCTILFGLSLLISPGTPWNYQLPVPNERTVLLHEVLALVPPNASILTQNDIFPHVSDRAEAYMYIPQHNNVSVDYIFIDLNSEWSRLGYKGIWEEAPTSVALKALRSGEYGIRASAKGILLLKKGYNIEPVFFIPFTEKYDYKSLILASGDIIKDATSSSGYVFSHGKKDPEGTFWYGPYIQLTPGLYKVTYVIEVRSEIKAGDEILEVCATTSSGKKMLAREYVYGVDVLPKKGWFNVTLFFGLDTIAEDIEFSGFIVGNHSVCLDYVLVEQLSCILTQVKQLNFNHRDLYMDEGLIPEDIIIHTQGSGIFWFGPYVSLPRGNYTARF